MVGLIKSDRPTDRPLERIFCAAPMSTASMRGVVPILAVMGAKNAGNKVKEKKAAPEER